MSKATDAQLKALHVLDLDGEAWVSNITDEKARTIYWQTGRWLVNQGFAKVTGWDGSREKLGITPEGRQEAAKS